MPSMDPPQHAPGRNLSSSCSLDPILSPSLLAGFLLAANIHLRRLGLPHPMGAQILNATGSGRTQAYELRRVVLRALTELQRPPGRPTAPRFTPVQVDPSAAAAALRFVIDHPGCIRGGAKRKHYSEDFRRFILNLREEHERLDLASFSKTVQVPLPTLHDWLRQSPPASPTGSSLPDTQTQPNGPKATHHTTVRMRRVLELLHHKPGAFGINRTSWSQKSLVDAYQARYKEAISRQTIGNLLRKAGYRWRKARRVLTSPDPDYRGKVERLLRTLWSLEQGELLFFVDELGPLRVKRYRGRAYLKKGEQLAIPQRQQHKGSVTLSGALSATTNQVSWLYGLAKDTGSMIDLIEILFNQHFDATKLYITWDAASWHGSSELVAWLDDLNAETRNKRRGPLVELIPLPSSAQFLDVIEAVFSAMKRAVIHHSDYASEENMKIAISRHFAERNEYFRDNPKRVGKKIWELDFFKDYDTLKAGDYREW
jgi:transposase